MAHRRLCLILLFGVLAFGLGCGGSLPQPGGSSVPAFKITSLSPASVIAGWSDIALDVTGTSLAQGDVLNWNGQPVSGSGYTGENNVMGIVPASMLTAVGSISITVSDGNTVSNALTFQITPAAPGNYGVVQLVSVGADGSQQNAGTVSPPAVSANGRYVAFESQATNLIASPMNNCITPLVGGTCSQVYERDTCNGAPAGCQPATYLVSLGIDGQVANNSTGLPAINADGRYVAFESIATNLISGDTNPPANPDIFLRDTCIGAPAGCVPSIIRVDIGPNGEQASGDTPSISATGRYIVFSSDAPNLIAGGDPHYGEVYVRDTCNGASSPCTPATTMASVNNSGQPDPYPAGGQEISQAGRYVAFISSDFLGNDTTGGVYIRDTCVGAPAGCIPSTFNTYLTYNGGMPKGTLAAGSQISVSDDAQYVSFSGQEGNSNLVLNDPIAHGSDVFERITCFDHPSGCNPTTILISQTPAGAPSNAGAVEDGGISPAGTDIVFASKSTDLAPNVTTISNVYVRSTCNYAPVGCVPTTVIISRALDGYPGDGGVNEPEISADGHWVVFLSNSTTLLMPQQSIGGNWNVFLAKTGY